MAIAIKCPNCGRRYNLSGTLAGKAVRCTDCQTAFAVPAAAATVVQLAPPQYALLPPEAESGLAAPSPRPARRKRKNAPMFLIAGAACGLLTMAVVAGLLIWGVYSGASSMVAVSSPPQAAQPASQAIASRTVQPVRVAPTSLGIAPAVVAANSPAEPSVAEQVLQKLIAKSNELNGLLAQVVDGPSAIRLQEPILTGFSAYTDLLQQLEAAARTISSQEDRRLESLYMAPFKNGVDQIKNHLARIRALGSQWAFDDMHRRIDEMRTRPHGPGPAPVLGFPPPQAAGIERPHLQPPTVPRPSIPRPSHPRMRPPTIPHHRFGR